VFGVVTEQLVGDAGDDVEIDPLHVVEPNKPTATVRSVEIERALGHFLEALDAAAPGLVEGLYVVGSFALGDWQDGVSDINIVAVTAEPATDGDVGDLQTAHALLAEVPGLPRIEGPYLAWGDLVVEPATGLHRPWYLGGRLHHDGDCFDINPITWYVLDRYGVTVRGPSPARLGIPTDTTARIRFVVDELRTYWRDVATQVATACTDDAPSEFDAASLVWCVLGALRAHATAFTGDVVSKRAAGVHGIEVLPSTLHGVVRRAMELRASGERGGTTTEEMLDATEVVRWCIAEVEAAAD